MSLLPLNQPIVCLFGSALPKPGEFQYQLAYDIGAALAKAGYTLANGGYGGVMEASARGAKDHGGATIGVTCTVIAKTRKEPGPNPYIDHEICHHHLLQRVRQLMNIGSAYVVLEGGTGTMVELAVVWEYVCKRFIPSRPIFAVGDFWRPTIERMIAARQASGKHIHLVDTPEEIVRIAAREIRFDRLATEKALTPPSLPKHPADADESA